MIPYSLSAHEAQECVPLGSTIVNYFHNSSTDLSGSFPVRVYDFMSNLPARSQSDVSLTMEQLLGPPTMEGALRCVEIGVYMCSNNLEWWGGVDNLSKWMIETIPWSALRPIFSVNIRSLRAFTERFLAYATEIGNVEIVQDLLRYPRLLDLVRSSGDVLVKAVKMSNARLVKLILSTGVDPNKRGKFLQGRYGLREFWTPLSIVEIVEIAEMLVDAGADPNGVGPLRKSYIIGPAIFGSITQRNIQVTRYLISLGANVDVPGEGLSTACPRSYTALSLAVENGQHDMVELLLKAGVDANAPYDQNLFKTLTPPEVFN